MNHLSVWLRLAVRVLRLWSVCVAWMPLCWPYTLARSSDARSTAKKLLFYLALTAYLSSRFRTRAKFDRIFFASIVRTVYRAIRQPSVRCFPPRNSKQRSTRYAYQRFSTRFPRRNTGRVLIKIGKRRLARNRRRFRRCGFYAFHLFRSSEATSPRFTGRGFRRQFKKRRLSRASTKFAVEREPCQP